MLLREAAQERYNKEELPSLKYGLTIKLNAKGLSLAGQEQSKSKQEVNIKQKGCEVTDLISSLERPDVRKHLLTTKPESRTKLEDFNDAFFDTGTLVIAPENTAATLELERNITSTTFKSHTLIICKKRSKLTVTDHYRSDNCTLHSSTIEVITEEGAEISYAGIQDLNKKCYDLTSHQAKLGKNSRIDWFTATLGAKVSRSTINNELGEGSEARSYGVHLGNEEQQFDLGSATTHLGNNSNSDMYVRGVLGGKAKAVFRGLIKIDKDAANCDGYQKEETILISDQAGADAIPNLEIMNNEVKCSHGATIGRIDEKQLFYLTSRGVNKEEATRMIVEGFFEPITTKLGRPELFEKIKPTVRARMT